MIMHSGFRRVLIAAVLLGLALSPAAFATRFMGGGSVYVADTVEIDDDLFTGGQNININGHIRGDLVAAGMSATLDGEVDGSVAAFVYDLKMCGDCRNSVRVFARRIDIDGHIERNLMAFGEEVIIGTHGWVEKDIHFGASTVLIQGHVGGKLEGSGDKVYISGQIDGDVKIEAPEVVVQPTAIIGGNLTTTGYKEPKIEPGAQILGETTHSTPKKKEPKGYSFLSFLCDAWSFLALALTGGVLLGFFGGFTLDVTQQIKTHWLKSLGLGFVFFVGLPIAAVILIVTLIGIPLGVVVLAGWGLLCYLAKVFIAIIVGDWLLRKLRGGRSPKAFWSMILGVVVIILALKIPFFGFLAKILIATIIGGWILTRLRRRGSHQVFRSIILGVVVILVLATPFIGPVINATIIFLAFGGFFLAAAERHAQTRQSNETVLGSDPVE